MTVDVGRAVTRLVVRDLRWGTVVLAGAVAGLSAVVAGQHRSLVGDAGGALDALAANPAIRVLFGPPLALTDPGGFTVWRTGTLALALVAVWAALTATRLTRGEEDAGRTELLLAGRLTATDLVVRRLVGVLAATTVVGALVAGALAAAGTDPVGALVHGGGVTGTGLVFASAGVLAAQLMPSRAAASGLAVGLLGIALAVRMLADGVPEVAWLAWTTPFGLAARSAPFAGNRVLPLVVLAALAVLVAGAALAAARGRDLGHGRLPVRSRRPPRLRTLRSLTGFAVRRVAGPELAWSAGLAAYLLLVGTLLAEIIEFLDQHRNLAALAAAAGFAGLGTPTGFAATMFALVSVPAGLFVASRVAALTAAESARRTTALLAGPLSRTRHLGTETAVLAVAVLVPLVVAGLAFWVGAAGTSLSAGAAVAGTLNTAPLAWLSLGAAVLAHGWVPRWVFLVGALPTAGGFLLQVVGNAAGTPDWLVAVSPYHHLAPVPASGPAWPAAVVLTAVAAGLVAVGLAGYARRDTLS